MTTYLAWDGNEYPWPPPQGWYTAVDGRWWPEGYGPGPATSAPTVAAPTDPTTVIPTAPAPEPTAVWSPAPAPAVDPFGVPAQASPAPNLGEPSSAGGKGLMIGLALLALLIVGAAGVFFATRGGGDGVATGPGSATDPHRLGQLVRLSYDDPTTGAPVEWTLEVLAPLADETEAVLALDAGLTRPAEGIVLGSTTARVVHVAGPATTIDSLRFEVVNPNGARSSEFGCANGPEGWGGGTAMNPADSVEGRLCWALGSDQVAGTLLVVTVPGVEGEVYVRLQ